MAGQPGAASAAQGLKGAFKVTAAGKERKIIKWLVAVILILLTLVLALAPAAWQWHKAKSREEALLQVAGKEVAVLWKENYTSDNQEFREKDPAYYAWLVSGMDHAVRDKLDF